MTHKGCVIQLSTTWEKGDPWVKRPKSIKKWMSYGNLPLLLRMVNNLGRFSGWFLCHCQCQIFDSIEFLIGQKWDPWVLNCTKKIQNPSRKGWVMAIFPLIGCVILMRTKRDKRGSLGVHLYQKDPKSVKKWLSYGHFPCEVAWCNWGTYGTEGGSLGLHLYHERSKICQEMAELWPFSCWEVK